MRVKLSKSAVPVADAAWFEAWLGSWFLGDKDSQILYGLFQMQNRGCIVDNRSIATSHNRPSQHREVTAIGAYLISISRARLLSMVRPANATGSEERKGKTAAC
jgi:hypothetical protein